VKLPRENVELKRNAVEVKQRIAELAGRLERRKIRRVWSSGGDTVDLEQLR
jgi:uncharacterized protein YgbK (DUF1537 family)